MKINSANISNTVDSNKSEISLEKLSSGKKINSAKDNAAAIQILSRVLAEQGGSAVAIRNANDGVSYSQVAEDALQNVSDNLIRVEELAIQANNGALSSSDRKSIQSDVLQLQSEIEQTIESANFAGKPIFSGESVEFMVSVSQKNFQSLTINVSDVVEQLANFDVTTQLKAGQSLDLAKNLREKVNEQQSEVASFSNSIYRSINANQETQIASTATQERIESTDYALETAKNVSSQLQRDISVALRVQSNALPSGIEQLLS